MKTIDYKFSELCNEIDHFRNEAKYWKNKYEEEVSERIKMSNESLEQSKKGVAQALMFVLSVSDNPDGSLSISKENRKQLAKQYEEK